MKLIIRIFAMVVVFAGLTAASISSAPVPATHHFFGAAITGPMLPGPPCPTCNGGGGLHSR